MDIEFINSLITYRKEYNRSRVEFAAKQFLSGLFRHFEAKKIEKYPDYIFYNINNERFADYNTKTKDFYYSYDKIYSVLKLEFGLNVQKINELIQDEVNEHLKLGVITPKVGIIILLYLINGG